MKIIFIILFAFFLAQDSTKINFKKFKKVNKSLDSLEIKIKQLQMKLKIDTTKGK